MYFTFTISTDTLFTKYSCVTRVVSIEQWLQCLKLIAAPVKLGWDSWIWPWASSSHNNLYKKGNFLNISGWLSENFSCEKHSFGDVRCMRRSCLKIKWIKNCNFYGFICFYCNINLSKTMSHHFLQIITHFVEIIIFLQISELFTEIYGPLE